ALHGAAERRLRAGRDRLGRAAGKLHALSPLAALARGFAVPLSEEGRVLRHVGEFSPGAPISLRVVDGRVACRVEHAEVDAHLPEEP
nr:hypothetical protein [Gemmatimonadota bacterium]